MSQEDPLDNDFISYLLLNPDFDFQNDSISLNDSMKQQNSLNNLNKKNENTSTSSSLSPDQPNYYQYDNNSLYYSTIQPQNYNYPSTSHIYHPSSSTQQPQQPLQQQQQQQQQTQQQQMFIPSHPHLVAPTPIPPTGPLPGLNLMPHPPSNLYTSISPLDSSLNTSVSLTPSSVLNNTNSLHHSSPYQYHLNYLNSSNTSTPSSYPIAPSSIPGTYQSTSSLPPSSSSTSPVVDPSSKLKKSTVRAKSSTKSSSSSVSSLPKKRPRESLEDLELRVKELKTENADLQAHLLNVTQRTKEVQKQRTEMEKMMAEKLQEIEACQNTASASTMTQLFNSLNSIIQSYSDNYSDYGKCRQREVAYHLQQLEKLITPTTTTKMCLWTLQNKKTFYDRSLSPLYNLLCEELSLNTDQINKILERRKYIKNILIQQSECLNLIKNLKNMIEIKHKLYDKIIGKVQKSSTPSQIVKFLVWVGEKHDELSEVIRGYSDKSHVNEDATFFLSDHEDEV